MSMKKRAVIISGGTLEYSVVKEYIKETDFIIGVDRGLEFLDAYGIMPNYIVGDFDSVNRSVIDKYISKTEVPIRKFDPVKDASDTEIAVRLAMELGYETLIILGATGTRIDHMWANVQVLAIPYEANVEAVIIDEYNKIRLIRPDFTLNKAEAYGPYFSVFSLGGPVKDVTIKGAKYELKEHTLLPYDSLSVSNQFQGEELNITYQSGILILMESKEA